MLTKMTWTNLLLFLLSTCDALGTEQEERWLKTLDAVWVVESGRRLNPPDGDGGKAVGPLQIWQSRVDDCNRIIGYARWTYEDRRDWMKSAEMFYVSCKHYWPNGTMEQWARHWNGSPTKGPFSSSTESYWHRVKDAVRSELELH